MHQSILGKRSRDERGDALKSRPSTQRATQINDSTPVLEYSTSPSTYPAGDHKPLQQQANGASAKKQGTPEFFMKSLFEFMRNRGTPIVQMPRIGNSSVNLVALYGHVMKAGGSRRINAFDSGWSKIAGTLGMPGCEEDLMAIYNTYLAAYEDAWTTARKRQMPKDQHTARPHSPAFVSAPSAQAHLNVTKVTTLKQEDQEQQITQSRPSGASIQATSIEANGAKQEVNDSDHNRIEQSDRPRSAVDISLDLEAEVDVKALEPFYAADQQLPAVLRQRMRSRAVRKPKAVSVTTYASLELGLAAGVGAELHALRPYPTFQELGNVDIQALTRSLESALPSEVGNALDIMVVIAGDRRWGLPLAHCRDLLEALLDCLEDDLNSFLMSDKHAAARLSYHELLVISRRATAQVRHRRSHDANQLRKHQALERIMAVLTIIRNLSFTEVNQETIASSESCAAVLSKATELVSSPILEHHARLEIAKDLVTILAQIARSLVLADTVICNALLQFLASFVPDQEQSLSGRYDSRHEPYLPSAIDAFAKLLCRDTPNCQLIRDGLLSDLSGDSEIQHSIIYRLMTMALSPIPVSGDIPPLRLLEAHLPLIEHALVMAENLADFAPADGELASLWLKDFADLSTGLWRLSHLSAGVANAKAGPVEQPYAHIARKCAMVLRILSDKASRATHVAPFIRETQVVGTLLLPAPAEREMVENLAAISRP
jgi:SWI/SNF chromatin-remodeling complex subunit SWI1